MAHIGAPTGDRASRGFEKHPFPFLVVLNDKSIYTFLFSDGRQLVLCRASFSVCRREFILFLGRNCGRSYQHDAGVDASGLNAETARGEKAIRAGVGVDSTHENGIKRHAAQFKFVHGGCPEVDVRALEETTSHDAWWKLSLQKSIDDFFAHFEGIRTDAGADYCTEVTRICPQGAHTLDGVGDDVPYHAAPTGVGGTDDVILRIVEQHRYAIGGGNADANARECGD